MKDGTLSSINLILDSETTQALEKSANKSFRTLRKEASLRVIDHVIRFSTPCSTRLCNESSEVKVHIPITLKAKLAPCLYRGNYRVKTYVEECSRRLKDHLQRYPTISAVGIVQENTHAP